MAVEVAEISDAELPGAADVSGVDERLGRRRSVRDEAGVGIPQARGIDVEAEQRVRRQDAARVVQRRIEPAGVAGETVPVAGQEVAVDELADGMGMLRRDRQQPFEAGDGIVEALELAQQASAIVERIEVPGLARKRGVEGGEGVVVAGEAGQRIAAVEMRPARRRDQSRRRARSSAPRRRSAAARKARHRGCTSSRTSPDRAQWPDRSSRRRPCMRPSSASASARLPCASANAGSAATAASKLASAACA